MTNPRISTAAAMVLALALAAQPPAVRAQPAAVTIDDLAAAQRSALEAEARRALDRALDRSSDRNASGSTASSSANGSGGLAAQPIPVVPAVRPATAAVASAQTMAVPVSGTPAPVAARTPAAPDTRLQVAGAARTRSGWRVEVSTDTGTWWLAAGQPIPGTAWRVAEISATDVTLARPAEASPVASPRPATGRRRGGAEQRGAAVEHVEPPEQRRRFTLPAPQPSPQTSPQPSALARS